MSESCNEIGQKGKVLDVLDDIYLINVTVGDACGKCKMQGVCPAGKGRVLEVEKERVDDDLHPGETVDVYIEEKKGFQALFLGYIMPFLVMMAVLIIASSITGDEAKAGLFSLLGLVFYYAVLYLFRNKISKTFNVEIRK